MPLFSPGQESGFLTTRLIRHGLVAVFLASQELVQLHLQLNGLSVAVIIDALINVLLII